MKEYEIKISSNEAKTGCRKHLWIKDVNKVVEVSVPAGIVSGAYVYAYTPGHDNNGRFAISSYPVKVKIKRTKQIILAALIGICLAAAFLRTFYESELENTETFISTVDSALRSDDQGPLRQFNGLFNSTASVDLFKSHVDVESVISEIPYFSERYFLNELDEEMLENFCAMYSAIENFDTEAVYPNPIKNHDDLEMLLYLIYYECPELIQLQRNGMTLSTSNAYTGTIYKTALNYCMNRETYEESFAACSSLVNALAENTAEMSDYDKELYIYNYLAGTIHYNKVSTNCGSAFGAMIENQAKCDGICQAFKWICEASGLPCLIIVGYDDDSTDGHAWNIIQLNGKWYDVDLTADLRSTGRDQFILYPAFNVSNDWIRNRYNLDKIYAQKLEVPDSTSMDLDYHVLNGNFIYSGGDCVQTYLSKLTNAYSTGNGIIYMQFENIADYNAFINNISVMNQQWVDNNSIGVQVNTLSSPDYKTILIEVNFI